MYVTTEMLFGLESAELDYYCRQLQLTLEQITLRTLYVSVLKQHMYTASTWRDPGLAKLRLDKWLFEGGVS